MKTHTADHRSPPQIPASFLSNKTRKLLAANDRYICAKTTSKTILYSWRTSSLVWDTKDSITTAAFCPRGENVWLGTKSGAIIIKNMVSGKTVKKLDHAHLKPISFMASVRSGIVTISGEDGKLIIWTPDEGIKAVRMHRIVVKTECMATGGFNSSFLWTSKEHRVNVYNLTGPVFGSNSFDLSRRGANLGAVTSIAAYGNMAFFGKNDGFISVFRGAELVGSINGGIYSITALTAPSSTELWAGTRSGDILVFAFHTVLSETSTQLNASLLRQWRAHPVKIEQILHADSKAAVLSSDRNGTVHAWNATPSDILPTAPSASEAFMVQVLTWNVGAASPSKVTASNITSEWTTRADVLSIGLQEVIDLENPSQHAVRMLTNSDAGSTDEHASWQQFLEATLIPYGFTLVASKPLLGIMILLFVKREKASFMSNIKTQIIRTGIGGAYGNKGGVNVSFTMNSMSWSFTNCHLAAGHTAFMQRNRDATDIIEATGLHSDVSFFFGDTNYRISAAREQAIQLIKAGNWGELRRLDQLISQKTKNPSFSLCRFEEGLLSFRPTYKYDVGTSDYDSSEKNRVPAWCDRILFRGKSIQVLQYEANNEVYISDHKPVFGTYIVPKLV